MDVMQEASLPRRAQALRYLGQEKGRCCRPREEPDNFGALRKTRRMHQSQGWLVLISGFKG